MACQIIAEAGVNHSRDLATALKLCDIAKECGADVVKHQIEYPSEYCLSYDEMLRVYRHCVDIDIPFACTAFDVPSLRWLLSNCTVPFLKIGSGDWQNVELLQEINRYSLPIIESRKIPPAVCQRRNASHKFLHVVPEYPTPLGHCNLRRVKQLWCSGLSDHSGNPLIPALAVAMGAEIVEVHIKQNDTDTGPDMSSSLNPKQFAEMVSNIRMTELAL